MKHFLLKLIPAFAYMITTAANATSTAIEIKRISGGQESLCVEWLPIEGATNYDVTLTGEGLTDVPTDPQLVRLYPGTLRFDQPGLKAGDYTLTVTARDADGNILASTMTESVNVLPLTREGFAFTAGNVPGAYNADGTLKDGAQVIYVSAATVNSITLDVIKDTKGNKETKTGLTEILNAIGKGHHKTPLAIRFIGTISDSQFDGLKDGNYINFQGNNNSTRLIENITLEGIGCDATLFGYGICFKRAHNIEIRNIAIMLFGDDAISLDTDNTNIWLHNIDFFYGKPGKDADQVKGDGSIDMKYHSTDITINNNHFFDSGKVMGCGGTTGENENLRITYHHNWFDHADSRCPRLHYVTAHIYNNYYDGVPVYCIGNTTESSAFVENNYFRNCKRPMMISGQGTDSYDTATGTYTLKGTFSGQNGGMTKAYNNIFAENQPKLVYQTEHPTQFDAWLVNSRDEQLPSTAVSVKGAWPYSNFDTDETMYASYPDDTESVPEIVTTRAGRTDGGDLKWKFNNAADDEDHSVNTALKSAVTNYQSSLIAIQGDENFGQSSIISPSVDSSSTDTLYFDLQGRQVSAENLRSGVYIIRQNNTVKKTVIR